MFTKKMFNAKKAKELTKRGTDRKFKARIKEVTTHINNYIEISAMEGDNYTVYSCYENGTLPMASVKRIQDYYCALGYNVEVKVEEPDDCSISIYSRYTFTIDWRDYND